jgi:glycosyltransferase involved in cell wall biosynthesis
MKLSIIVCARNPDPGRLALLWAALAGQTGRTGSLELVVVDNGSEPALAVDRSAWPESWTVRVVREERVGLTPARLRGIAESTGEGLVFFDDDNEPEPAYAAETLALFEADPNLGVAGGRIDGVFETPPPRWAVPYLGWLAVRPGVRSEVRTEAGGRWEALPCGAGLCVRAAVAREYARLTEGDPRRLAFDRRGDVLTGSGDTDLALTALEVGLHARLTPRLRLRHHIPAGRLTAGYLERLLEGSAYSTARLALLRGVRGKPLWVNRLLRRIKRFSKTPPACWPMVAKMERAIDRGERRAFCGPA